MGSVPERSAEEFFEQCRENTQVLDSMARQRAAAEDAVTALALAWSADVYAAQGVLGERILGAAAGTRRRLFGADEVLIRGMRGAQSTDVSAEPSVADAIRAARHGLLAACDESLAGALEQAWPAVGYLVSLPAPSPQSLEEHTRARLEGMSADAFVSERRRAAVEQMSHAQSLRVRGDLAGAVQAAYDADFLGLDAYLVESAVAAGDAALFSVMARWELAVASVAALPGLPEGFVPAVTRIRRAMCAAMSEADAVRLLASLPPVD